MKHFLRAVTPTLVYEAAHRAKVAWRRRNLAVEAPFEPAVERTVPRRDTGWRKLDAWPDVGQGWEQYALSASIDHLPEMDAYVAGNGITALSPRLADRVLYLSFAYVVSRAAAGKARLSILDFGGHLGNYAAVAKSAVPEVEVAYTIEELPPIAAAGRTVRPWITWVSDDAELAERYDLVVASGALQYVRDWRAKLSMLARRADPWLFLSRLPILAAADSYVARQPLPGDGEAVGWCWQREEFVTEAQSLGFHLDQELRLAEEHSEIVGATETPVVRGYLFRRNGRKQRSDGFSEGPVVRTRSCERE